MPVRILVVDDFEPFREFVCACLHRRGDVETFEVSTGEEAIERAGVLQPDLILLDISLPTMHGIDVAMRMPAVAPQSRVLFVSHEQAPDVIAETLHAGAHGYVHKLCCNGDLAAAIDAALGGRHFVSSLLPSHRHGRHEVQFCSDDEVLIDAFARFAAASLESGNAAIVLATGPHRERIGRRLHGLGVDVDRAVARGTYIAADAASTLETIIVDGAPDRARFFEGLHGLIAAATAATGREDARVAICGECVALLCARGALDSALAIEEAGNDLMKADHVDILCAYPWTRRPEDDPMFSRVCAKHTAVRCL